MFDLFERGSLVHQIGFHDCCSKNSLTNSTGYFKTQIVSQWTRSWNWPYIDKNHLPLRNLIGTHLFKIYPINDLAKIILMLFNPIIIRWIQHHYVLFDWLSYILSILYSVLLLFYFLCVSCMTMTIDVKLLFENCITEL